MKNKLIVFEGIDGVGKTKISELLVKKLLEAGINATKYEDYEDKNAGFNLIKNFVVKKAPINSRLFFYLASSIYKSKLIKELLKNKWVVCDRYLFSTLAYHKARGADLSLVCNPLNLPIIFPDFLFLVKLSEKVRLERVMARKSSTEEDFKKKKKGNLIWDMERELEKFDPIIINNISQNINKTVNKIFEIVINGKSPKKF